MASSSNRKSNSSASSQKPTFRRSKGAAPAPRTAARPKPAARPSVTAQPPKATKSSYTVAAKAGAAPKQVKPKRVAPKPTARKASALAPAARAQGTPDRRRPAASSAPAAERPSASRKGRLGLIVAIAVALALVTGVGGVVAVNSSLFAATDIEVKGSEHVSEEDMNRLLDVPEGSTLFNIDADALAGSLKRNPWVDTVDVQREFPHKLIITPKEYKVAAVVYIAADDIAWAVSDAGTWIAPMSLSVTVDADGSIIESAGEGAALPASSAVDADTDDADAADSSSGEADGTDGAASDADAGADEEGAEEPDAEATGSLTGVDAALALARDAGALLLIDVSADVAPSSGAEATSDVVKAGLAYAKGFSREFLAQIKDLSVPSVEAISANLVSGVEVSLGSPEDIGTKEQVVTKLLAERSGVTYINVRTPDAYTFRSADLGA